MVEVYAMNANVKAKVGFKGRMKLIVRDGESAEITKETDWFNNLILDAGLNRFGTGAIITHCQVGTSSTPPVVGQTALIGYVGYTQDKAEVAGSNTGSPTYGKIFRYRFRFAVGAAAGNLSEVGIGWNAPGSLWSRALIVDEFNVPTTITVLSTEVLDVWYELELYVNQTDVVTTNFAIGPNLHTVTVRPALIANNAQPNTSGNDPAINGYNTTTRAVNYANPIGPITGIPSGGGVNSTFGMVSAPYANNSLKRSTTYTWGLTEGSTDVQSTLFTSTAGMYQVGYSPAIPKTSSKQLTLTFEWTWARL